MYRNSPIPAPIHSSSSYSSPHLPNSSFLDNHVEDPAPGVNNGLPSAPIEKLYPLPLIEVGLLKGDEGNAAELKECPEGLSSGGEEALALALLRLGARDFFPGGPRSCVWAVVVRWVGC